MFHARGRILAAFALVGSMQLATTPTATAVTFRGPASEGRTWPPGTDRIPVRLEQGHVLVDATLRMSGRSVSGLLILDTGAPGLVVTVSAWNRLQVDTTQMGGSFYQIVRRPLSSIHLGSSEFQGLTIGGVVEDSLLNEGVIGLLGPSLMPDRALALDYARSEWAIVPPRLAVVARDSTSRGDLTREARARRSRAAYAAVLSSEAVAVPFRLFEGGRILVDARACELDGAWCGLPLTLLLDTGASACVLFDDVIAERVAHARSWPWLQDVPFHTLLGTARMNATVVPRLQLTAASSPLFMSSVDAGVAPRRSLPDIGGTLPERIHGLLGATFLERFRIILDYGNQVLWLEARSSGESRGFASTHVGLRLERRWGAVRVAEVAHGSSASQAGIAVGDMVLAIDGVSLLDQPADAAESRLEGAAGSEVVLLTRHEGMEKVRRLRRTSPP